MPEPAGAASPSHAERRRTPLSQALAGSPVHGTMRLGELHSSRLSRWAHVWQRGPSAVLMDGSLSQYITPRWWPDGFARSVLRHYSPTLGPLKPATSGPDRLAVVGTIWTCCGLFHPAIVRRPQAVGEPNCSWPTRPHSVRSHLVQGRAEAVLERRGSPAEHVVGGGIRPTIGSTSSEATAGQDPLPPVALEGLGSSAVGTGSCGFRPNRRRRSA